MSDDPSLFIEDTRSNWIRLRTSIAIRWVAIVGQLIAVFVALQYYRLQIPIDYCLLFIGLSIIANLLATYLYPENKRLSETENLLFALFDLFQLSALIYLTGGLNNPFSILVIAPVVISSSVLGIRSAVLIGGISLIIVTVLSKYYVPLMTAQGFTMQIPKVFVFGNWAAIVITVVFLSIYARRTTQEMATMGDALFATQIALSREQKLTDLGGVIAAAAHELGTPLATIKLTAGELVEDLSDDPDLKEDAELIRQEANRCRDILHSMGRVGKDDLHLRNAPLSEVLREAAEPHVERGKIVNSAIIGDLDPADQPKIYRHPEIIHGLRNMIQNAVDFANSAIWVDYSWDDENITIRISDDGRGYPEHMLKRIGDPFVRSKKQGSDHNQRPGYKGMGLGLFIAKTLLERTGASLKFANGSNADSVRQKSTERSGAIVQITWERSQIEHKLKELGPNVMMDQY